MTLKNQIILDELGWENRSPKLINRGAGRLLIVYSSAPVRPSRRHMDISASVKMIHSEDDGQTWSSPELLITHDGQVSPTQPLVSECNEPTIIIPYPHWVVLPEKERDMLAMRVPSSVFNKKFFEKHWSPLQIADRRHLI